jgi:hypothetical protein
MQKSLSHFLENETCLSTIFHKLHSLKILNQLWQKKMDADLAKHSFIANQRDDILIIEIDNAAFATRLRYNTDEIILHLREEKEFFFLKKIEWYIRPSAVLSKVPKANKSKLLFSDNTIQLLNSTAENISNEKLKKALLKLASNPS